MAADNRVAIDLDLSPLISGRGYSRQRAIHRYRDILVLERRFEFPITLSSHARSILDMRAVREITGLCSLIGMDTSDVEKAFFGVDFITAPPQSGGEGDLMSTRPPRCEMKRRYLLVRIEPAGTIIDQKDLYYAVSECRNLSLGRCDGCSYHASSGCIGGQYAIIRCQRGTEQDLSVALSTITTCRETRIALRMVAASGTIDTLREKVRGTKSHQMQESPSPRECHV